MALPLFHHLFIYGVSGADAMLSGLAPLTWDASAEYLTQISEQVNQRIKNISSCHIEDDKQVYLFHSI